MDTSREWVVSDSKRIFWIPPGYIESTQVSYAYRVIEEDCYWAGSNTLVMVSRDEVLRALTFRS